MIEFHDFAGTGFQLGDAVLQPGAESLIVVDTAEQSANLLDCMTGLRVPAQGTVLIFGRNLNLLQRDERLQTLAKVGIIPQDAGLLTGLPAWKNILLPRQLQGKPAQAALGGEFDEAVRFCEGACDSGDEWMRLLPDYLDLYQRRIAAFLRLMLGHPLICIYENLTGNLPGRQKESLLALTQRFHRQQPGRISIYMEFDPALLAKQWSGTLLRGVPRSPSISNTYTNADAHSL